MHPAKFCVACGAGVGSAARLRGLRIPFERYAPLLVLGAVLVVCGAAVWQGARAAKQPARVPRRASTGQAALPEGHPPISVPDDVRAAIDRLAESAKARPDDVEAWKQLGFIQYRAGQTDPGYLTAAAATFEHILTKEPGNLDALRALGNIAFDRDQPQQAMEYYERYLAIQPGDPEVRTDLGTMLLSAQQPERAIALYQAVLADNPTFFQAQFNLAIAHRAAGDMPKAIAALRQARDIAADDATRQRVDQLLARLSSDQAAPPPPTGGADFKADVESVFRSHPIVGPKIDLIEWPTARTAKVVLRQFPMDTMPDDMRERFIARLGSGLREKKGRHQITDTLRIELVDSASGRVMGTITE